MSYGRMAKEERRLRGEIEALLAAAGAADAAEDARLGADVRGDELPAELRRREDVWRRSGRRSRGWRRSSGQRTTPAVGSRTKTEPEGRAALQAVVWRTAEYYAREFGAGGMFAGSFVEGLAGLTVSPSRGMLDSDVLARGGARRCGRPRGVALRRRCSG